MKSKHTYSMLSILAVLIVGLFLFESLSEADSVKAISPATRMPSSKLQESHLKPDKESTKTLLEKRNEIAVLLEEKEKQEKDEYNKQLIANQAKVNEAVRLEKERLENERLETERLAKEREEEAEKQLALIQKEEEVKAAEEQKKAEPQQKTKQSEVPSEQPAPTPAPASNGMSFQATGYSAYDGTQSGVTAGGTNMAGGNITTASGHHIIAADPSVLPLGTVVSVTLSNGQTFTAKVDDTGGAINGNKIDIAYSSPSEAFSFGRQAVTVQILR